MSEAPTLELRLTGDRVSLTSVPAREWLPVVDAWVAGLQAVAGPDTVLAITGIGDGSVSVRLRALCGDVSRAWQGVRDAIETQTVQRLPGPDREAVASAVRFARKYAGQVQIGEGVAGGPITTIHADTPVLGPGVLREATVIYGRVWRVGGAEPKIGLEVDLDGARLSCGCGVDLAQKVAPLLYRRVGLWGEARWDPENWSLVEFEAKDLSDYREGPVAEGLAALAAIVGEDRWGDNVVEAVRAVRSDEP